MSLFLMTDPKLAPLVICACKPKPKRKIVRKCVCGQWREYPVKKSSKEK